MRRSSLVGIALAAVIVSGLGGCGTLRSGRDWGQDATLLPDAGRVRKAVWAAVVDPYTWGPALGAATFGLAGWDRKVSDWAREHHSIFGSEQGAKDASDILVGLSCGGLLGSAMATPSADSPRETAAAKAQGLLFEVGTVGATLGLGEGIKRLTGRERPDGSDRASFPSGHTAAAFACSSLARRNLETVQVGEGTRVTLSAASTVLAVGTGWARVEAGKHYPSDVLAAAALANFLSVFSYDAFLGVDRQSALTLSFAPASHFPMVVLTLNR